MSAHIYDDFYVQCMILILLSVAIAFIVDVVIEIMGGKKIVD